MSGPVRVREPEAPVEESKASQKFLTVMSLAGAGLALFVMGLVLPFAHAPFREVFGGGLTEWRRQPLPLVITGSLLILGVALLLGASLMARGSEHQGPAMRRLMYGANTVVAGMLLVGILLFVNVFSNLRLGRFDLFNQTFDHTESALYTLSPKSTGFLEGLTEPVEVYLFVNPFSGASQFVRAEMTTLIENCRRVQPGLVRFKLLEVPSDLEEYDRLGQKYQFPRELGMLIVYGAEGKQNHEFVKLSDLYRQDRGPMTQPGQPAAPATLQFLGEAKLFDTLVFLSENKSKGVIYLTTGNGEYESAGGEKAAQGGSIAELAAELNKANYRVEKLPLDASIKSVPADADIVLMAGPRLDPPAEAITALDRYLQGTDGGKKGKLVLLLDAARERQGGRQVFSPMPRLKGLLAKLRVELEDSILLSARLKPPTDAVGIPNPRSGSPLAKAFISQGQPIPFPMREARPVKALSSPAEPGGAPPALEVEPFLVAYPQFDTRAVSDASASFEELVKSEGWKEGKNPAKPTGLLSLGVTSQEGGKPRAVVIGNARFVTDDFIRRVGDTVSLELVASCCGWLRERPGIGSKPVESNQKFERKTYQLRTRRDTLELGRMRWLPLGLAMVAIFGLGAGMWLVRRNA
jgi:hypothetical protein